VRSSGWGDPSDARRDQVEQTPYTEWYAEFERTGICPRYISGSDRAHVPCSICRHSDYMHGGFLNPDPEMTGCLICHLKQLARRDADRPLRELEARRSADQTEDHR
jgi:hypothetical protein